MSDFAAEAKAMLEKVKACAAQAMNTTAVDGMHEAIRQAVYTNVYAAYPHPKVYERRYEGGMMSEAYNELTKSASADDLSIEITNTAPGNGGYAPTDGAGAPADSVENGGPWNFPLSPDPGPRPFMEPAAELYVGSGRAAEEVAGYVNSVLK